ncbi:MAG: FAD-binding oxidoreductase, partial [Proteobacteria bacterium]|nr:FAD-binding oxidoreductase [Pseudomonadota bacterium]
VLKFEAHGYVAGIYRHPIENVVMGLGVDLPNGGILETRLTPRSSSGPDLKHIFLGSEGTLGIITVVTFSLHRKPESIDPGRIRIRLGKVFRQLRDYFGAVEW